MTKWHANDTIFAIQTIKTVLGLLLFASAACNAAYHFSLREVDSADASVIVSGGGQNYVFKPLAQIVSENAHLKDPALQAFLQIAESYKNGTLERKKIDLPKAIAPSTPLSDILINLTIFDGRTAVIMSAGKQNGGKAQKTVTCLAFDGNRESFIQNFSEIPENLVSLATAYASNGVQLERENFKRSMEELLRLDGKTKFPLAVRLTAGPGDNSFAFSQ